MKKMPRRARVKRVETDEAPDATYPVPPRKRKPPTRREVSEELRYVAYVPRNTHPRPLVDSRSKRTSDAPANPPPTLRSLACETCIEACHDLPKLLDHPLESAVQTRYITFRCNLLPLKKVLLVRKVMIHAIAAHPDDAVVDALIDALEPIDGGGVELSAACAMNAFDKACALAASSSHRRTKQRLFFIASLVLPNKLLSDDLLDVVKALVNTAMTQTPLPLTAGVAFDALWSCCGKESLPLVPAFNDVTSPRLELLSPLFRLQRRGMRMEQVLWLRRYEAGRLITTAIKMSGKTVETLGIPELGNAVAFWPDGREPFLLPDNTPDWAYVIDFICVMNCFNLVPYMISDADPDCQAVRKSWENQLVGSGFGMREACFDDNGVKFLFGFARWWGYWSPLQC